MTHPLVIFQFVAIGALLSFALYAFYDCVLKPHQDEKNKAKQEAKEAREVDDIFTEMPTFFTQSSNQKS
jgi:hypothetical protein